MQDVGGRYLSSKDKMQFDAAFLQIMDFYRIPTFQNLIEELKIVPEDLRHEFVEAVMLSASQLAMRGIKVPAKLKIQRTQFYDNRPTLFCITHEVNIGPWRKLTVTFDNTGGPCRPVLKDAIKSDSNTVPVM